MNLNITFNWPTGEDSASVEMGQPNVNDKDMEFRVGAVQKERPDRIAWHVSGWVLGDRDMGRVTFRVRRGDKVVVERRKKDGQKTETRTEWNIDDEWPPEARGAALTVVPWYF